ncbi:hypothetical protein [Halobellus rarus]|uniref:Uncharacterized protein n=1 Tax=Halobellus rarus TaxID=1126237 RepID=A0ABD6CLI5_9EURY|nr:hypothetical protein [Halobellus rarus]
MASRNQAAISSDEKLLLLVVGLIIGSLLVLGLVFQVANGVASGIAGFLYDIGIPREIAMNTYKTVKWGLVGLLLIALVKVMS